METGTGLSLKRSYMENAERLVRTQQRFLQMVSHDLKSPLAAVRGAIEILRSPQMPLKPEKIPTLLEMIDAASFQMEHLLKDLTDFSSMRVGKVKVNMVVADIRPVLEEVLAAFRSIANIQEVRIASRIQPGLPLLSMDSQRISQVLTNLLSNAVKYTPRGGKIVLTAMSVDHHVEIKISNTGNGIPQKDLARIFDPYYQGSNSDVNCKEGMGLGLTICKEIVARHGGSIKVTSEPNKETQVRVELPLRQENERYNYRKALIIDDEPVIAKLVKLLLTESGFEVAVAESISEALEKIDRLKPDLIILDLLLPDGNGMEILQHLKSKAATDHISIIIASVLTDKRYQLKVANLGASAFVKKPFKLTELVDVVEDVLNRERRPLVASPAGVQKSDAESILVVDDDEDMLYFCEVALAEAGFNITTAQSGKEAVTKLESKRFRVVLTDNVQIPFHNRSVLQEVKLRWPDTNVVVMSSSKDPKYFHQVLKEGAIECLKKPCLSTQLVSAVQRCVAR